MTILAVLAALLLVLLLHSARKRSWRRAELDLAQRFPLGGDGIIPGAQSIYHSGHARGILLLHGFGDTPQSLAALAERLVEAGWSVSVPLLSGHGRTLAAFHDSGASDWIKEAERAYAELTQQHEPVVICGQSMGAALAIGLAARRPAPALVLLAPYIAMPWVARWTAAVWPIAQLFAPVVWTYDPKSVRDPKAAERSLGYGYLTPRLLAELWQVVRRARRDAGRVRSPTLIVHSREDNRVPAGEVAALAARIDAVKALQWVSGCGHVIAVDYCKESVTALMREWLERHAATQGAATGAR